MKVNPDLNLKARKKISNKLKILLKNSKSKSFPYNEYASSDIRLGHLNDKVVKRLVIHLRSNGCAWKRKSGGCTMCGFWDETKQQDGLLIQEEDYLQQFDKFLKKFDLNDYPIISIYNAGSLLNESEVPFSCLEKIIYRLSFVPNLRRVVLESRVEYITRDKIKALKKLLGSKDLIIGSGLESSNNTVRELLVHKGLKQSTFEKYIEFALSLNFTPRIYLLIKPPFLTEREAIEDMVNSTRYLNSLGVKDIHYETMTVEKNTLVFRLFQKGYYKEPWLWSIIEILKRVSSFSQPFVSPFRYIADAEKIPSNCKFCSARVRDLIVDKYCQDFDIRHFENLSCSCQEKWQEALKEEDSRSLEERVIETLDQIYL